MLKFSFNFVHLSLYFTSFISFFLLFVLSIIVWTYQYMLQAMSKIYFYCVAIPKNVTTKLSFMKKKLYQKILYNYRFSFETKFDIGNKSCQSFGWKKRWWRVPLCVFDVRVHVEDYLDLKGIYVKKWDFRQTGDFD